MSDLTFTFIYAAFCFIVGFAAGVHLSTTALLIIAIPGIAGVIFLRIYLQKYLTNRGIIK